MRGQRAHDEHHLRRPDRRPDPPDGRQGRGTRARPAAQGADGAGVPRSGGGRGRGVNAGRKARLPGDHQGGRGRRWEGDAGGAGWGAVPAGVLAGQAGGAGGVRLGRGVPREVPRPPAAHRDPDHGRHARAHHAPVRARLLGAAAPPEARRGSAQPRRGCDAAPGHRRLRGAARRSDRLRGRGDDRVPARRGRLLLLLHGDEHPHPGRASRHRDVHELRPGEGANPRGRGRAPVVRDERQPAAGARDRVPRERRRSGAELPAEPRDDHRVSSARRTGRARRHPHHAARPRRGRSRRPGSRRHRRAARHDHHRRGPGERRQGGHPRGHVRGGRPPRIEPREGRRAARRRAPQREDRRVRAGQLTAGDGAGGGRRQDDRARHYERHACLGRGAGRGAGAGGRSGELQGTGRARPRGAARAARSGGHLCRPREAVRHRGRLHGGPLDQSREEGRPQGRLERRCPGRPRPHPRAGELDRSARGLRGGAPAGGRRSGGGRRLCRPAGPVRRGPHLRGPAHHMNAKARQELVGIGALVVGLFLGLTLLRLPITGSWGDRMGSLLWRALGAGSVLLPLLGIGWALAAFERLGSLSAARTAALGVGLVLLLPYGIGTVTGARFPGDYTVWSPTQKLVGLAPALLAHGVHQAVGTAGGELVGLFALSALGLLTVGWHPLVALRTRETAIGKREPGSGTREAQKPGKPAKPERTVEAEEHARERTIAALRAAKTRTKPPHPASRTRHPVPRGVLIPPIDLLNPAPPEDGEAGLVQIEQMGQKLIETLQTFRVEGSIVGRTVGPVVTQYEVAPGPGVKVGRIAALADDLALAMRAPSLRIVAPIPGKAAVGIEVPNPMPRLVHIRELLESGQYPGNRVLPIALGKNLEGEPVVADLAKMPHLLIAGATGSGKSVSINTIITSLVYTHPPDKLKLLMIDPKMVELSMYAALPHLGLPVVTNYHKAASVLKWAVWEMERRYRLLHANHARNIVDLNKKVEEKKPLKGPRETLATQAGIQKELPFDAEYTGGILPYIVLIVDELADLMLTVQSEIETPLATLAQKARAIGIHIVLATQRPSVNVITGLIKANFPCRIAFRVSAKVDSRTILDQNGAETLLGNGDMLFLPPGKSELVRVQGAFISTEETERLMEGYKVHAPAAAPPAGSSIGEQVAALEEREKAGEEGSEGVEETGERDPLFRQAAEVCINNQIGSTSLLQRRMSIGYGRAARIIDQLEMAGILGPANGSKPRDVLIGLDDLDEICGD